MTFAEIKELNAMGFSHDEIISIMTGSMLVTPTAPAPAEVPAEVPAAVPAAVPAETPAAPAPAPAPVQAPEENALVKELANKVGQLIQTIQAGNIIDSRNQVPKVESVDDVMAQILNPRTKQPLGGD